ncbi:MAG TPA: hypothetical protein ENI77_08995 [Nitrospirae bacterium]|nr:hypothetical protein [Nitrospirota bacterium]
MKPIIFWTSLIIILIVCAEIGSWAFFGFYGKQRLIYHERVDNKAFINDVLNASPESYEKLANETIISWSNSFQSANSIENKNVYGVSRPTPYSSDNILISTYGDSFTYCQDVKDSETWQYYLSQNTDSKALNYGVKGYGTGQALLKLMERLKAGHKTRIVILGILSENIARVVNLNNKYYWSTGSYRNFKPALVKDGASYKWVGDYIKRLSYKEGRLEAINAVEQYDFWYSQNKYRPKIGFPYLISAVDTIRYFLFYVKRWPDLWQDKNAVDIMRHILDNFYKLSKKHKFIPVILFIPHGYDLKRKEKGLETSYARFKNEIKKENGGKFDLVIDASQGDYDSSKFHLKPYVGHASAFGNRWIAKAVYSELEDKLKSDEP